MPRHPSLLLHGLLLTVRRFSAVLWAYAFNLALALVFTLSLHSRIESLTAHSFYAQRLTGAFDIGVFADVSQRLAESPEASGISRYAGVPIYLAVYFLLVPGTLFCFRTGARARLRTLLHSGIESFWSFVRITLLTLLVSGIVLGPLAFFQARFSSGLEEDTFALGRTGFILRLASLVLILLVASVLRLYFDLVEVHTVSLGLERRPHGKPDRRVRRTLIPAFQTLQRDFLRAWFAFLVPAFLGAAAAAFAAHSMIYRLAQPRVWPTFLISQTALLFLLFIRVWQRGAETVLVAQHRSAEPPPRVEFYPTNPAPQRTPDPIPNPEPASPSLSEPDPGVYHHDAGQPPSLPPE